MNCNINSTHNSCHCCTMKSCPKYSSSGVTRRDFMAGMGTLAAGGLTLSMLSTAAYGQSREPVRISPIRFPLKVQPVFAYHIPQRHEGTSWRGWGGIHTEQDANAEKARIQKELEQIKDSSDFPVEILPLISVQNSEQGARAAAGDHDVLLMYAASCGTDTMEALSDPKKWTLVFLRHKSGPVYLWYEIVHNRYLRKTVDEYGQPNVGNQDVIVDKPEEVLWRLRALSAVKNTLNKKMLCIGGASGWGEGGRVAPEKTKEIFKMDLVDVSYEELGKRIQKMRENTSLVKWCEEEARKYLAQEGVSLSTDASFIPKSFLLTEVFHELMAEAKTDSITINHCMGTIMRVSETTACLPLTLLNDAGYMAFCESDFVVIPSGVLLHYISGKPVFLNDPTYPHDNIVTLAHCTAPRKNDGKTYDDVNILTHFESDWGAAPKVEMKLGEKITVIDPDFNFQKWMGFKAEIVDNPFYDICRSQIDVQFDCSTEEMNEETRGFHWMACYGDYLKETGYALGKVGIEWKKLA